MPTEATSTAIRARMPRCGRGTRTSRSRSSRARSGRSSRRRPRPELYEHARALAREIGFDPSPGSSAAAATGTSPARSASRPWTAWGRRRRLPHRGRARPDRLPRPAGAPAVRAAADAQVAPLVGVARDRERDAAHRAAHRAEALDVDRDRLHAVSVELADHAFEAPVDQMPRWRRRSCPPRRDPWSPARSARSPPSRRSARGASHPGPAGTPSPAPRGART